ncbi:MBL fold metallo-hydrolase [Streptomyces yunnanensis]|uniref:MBL fold metallo-hydrolase n=1 Tax=Streptomyces yunnanensis TaxID=156453 RepID=A0ABY8A3T3_9ACTN|nr:MBL fold metallo-hydrolase [Streptomyces yunnanensis]WEB39624.1 MBL fold metallo-hydrolase [Streptomyces yunnanensis]
MSVKVTWWGHATVTVEDSGVRVLTDPLFVARLAHLRRRRGALPPPEAAHADAVLISHLHADHLHPASLARLAPGTRLIVPYGAPAAVPGLRKVAAARGLPVSELRPGQECRIGPPRDAAALTVRAVPAAHDGRRLPYGPHRVPALGYVISGTARTYFAGDTGLFPELPDEVGPCEVALLPVGGWGPFLGHGHLDARRAAVAAARLAPCSAVPVHYGTYWPIGLDAVRPHEFHAPGQEFERQAGLLAPEVTVHRLGHGESVHPRTTR